MIKQVALNQLKPGMYVANLGADKIARQVKHPVGFVQDDETIRQLFRFGLSHVYIDTDKGRDIGDTSQGDTLVAEAVADETVTKAEVTHARQVYASAINTISTVMQDVKLGRHINKSSIETAVDNILSSVVGDHGALLCLGMIRSKDSYLMEHSVNTSVIITIYAQHIGYPGDYVRQLATGALLHDIGKIMVPANILHKPGKLTDEEFSVMREHSANGRNILQAAGFDSVAVEMAGQHHEHVDGSGYPDGLATEAISRHGKMLAIVDVYDALTADRCYHNRLTPHETMRNMLKVSRLHFDAVMLHRFIKSIGVYPVGSVVLLSDGKIGMVVANSKTEPLNPVVRVFFDHERHCYIGQKDIDLADAENSVSIAQNIDPRKLGIDMQRFFQ